MTDWTFVIPFYNEAAFLPETLASLRAQELKPFRLLLIDNGSTDGSADVARKALEGETGIDWQIVDEARPGKINALDHAMGLIDTPFAAFGDADTFYPPHYLATADRLFRKGGAKTVAVMAMGIFSPEGGFGEKFRRFIYPQVITRLLAKQVHTGGYGQSFRMDALRKVGGFSAEHWPYVLLDHEIMQRLFKLGGTAYHPDMWCRPSPRRTDRSKVRWNLAERLLYNFTPYSVKDWYFYRFLGPRLKQRGSDNLALREKSWEKG